MAYTDDIVLPLTSLVEDLNNNVSSGKRIIGTDWENILDLERHCYINRFETIQTQIREMRILEGTNDITEPLTNGRIWYDPNADSGAGDYIALSIGTIYKVPDRIPGTPNRSQALDSPPESLNKNGGLYCAFILKAATAIVALRKVVYETDVEGKTTGRLSSVGTWRTASADTAMLSTSDYFIVEVTDTTSSEEGFITFPPDTQAGDLYEIRIFFRAISDSSEVPGICAGYLIAELPLENANPS